MNTGSDDVVDVNGADRPETTDWAAKPEPFSFAVGEFEKPTLETAVFQSLGAASMCWDERPSGVFDSTRAKEIGDHLVNWIRAEYHLEPSGEKIYIRQGRDGDWYWNRRARNGRSISTGGEGYSNFEDCSHMAHRLNRDVSGMDFVVTPRSSLPSPVDAEDFGRLTGY